jgi:3-phosphoshikimate 1-carboxyvinyltransferase
MAAALRRLGVQVDDTDPACWEVAPPQRLRSGGLVDCGLAGTVLRFVPPLAALAEGTTLFTGDPAAAARPIGPLLAGLRQIGVAVAGQNLPFAVTGPPAASRKQPEVVIDASGSSQFISGLLLAAARFPAGLRLRHEGPPLPSLPHIDMTIQALADRGVVVELLSPAAWRVEAGPVRACREAIEPDLTTAAVFLAAALAAGGTVTVPAWPDRPSQPGRAAPGLLTCFGGSWRQDADGLTVTGDGNLRGADLDLRQTSELTPVAAALAALADSPSVIRGVAHIRGHETDRLAALAREINSLGGRCAETADGLAIEPARLHGGLWRTYGDHRLAHAGALIGLRVPGVELDDVSVVSKTMPQFAAAWRELLR